MTEHVEESLQTDGSLVDYFSIENHLLATRSADAYKAIDRSRNMSVCLWTMREAFEPNSQDLEDFLTRLNLIDSLKPPVSRMTAFAVDAEGIGFAVFPPLDGTAVDSGNIELQEAERRLTGCLQIIQRLHADGIVCGDLSGSSFIVERSGIVRLLGVMGARSLSRGSAACAYEALPFVAPEQHRNINSGISLDVYSLGVLGYFLFTGSYPYGEGTSLRTHEFSLDQIKPVSAINPRAPLWASTVLAQALDPDPGNRFPDAGAFLTAITDARREQYSNDRAPVMQERSPILAQQTEEGVTVHSTGLPGRRIETEEEGQTPRRSSLSLRAKILLSFLVLSLVSILVIDVIMDRRKNEQSELRLGLQVHRSAVGDEELKEAIDVITEQDMSLDAKAKQLETIANSDDPIAHDILVRSATDARSERLRKLTERSIVQRAQRLGLQRSAEQVRQWLRTLGAVLPAQDYESILKSIDTSLPQEARQEFLMQAYPAYPELALRITAGYALDTGEHEAYQGLLANFVRDHLRIDESFEEKSLLALILADPSLSLVFGDDVIQRKEELSDADVRWLLSILADRSDLTVRAIANLGYEREVVTPLRLVFLETIRDRSELAPDVLKALIKASGGVLEKDDLIAFGKWYDLDAEKVLLAISADSYDQEIYQEAFDVLAGRTILKEPAASLVQWVRKNYWDERHEFAHLIGVLSNLDRVKQEEIESVFQVLDRFARDSDLIEILLETDNPEVLKLLIRRYPKLLGLGILLNLLGEEDKTVRIEAVKSLSRFNDVGALRLILERYEEEKDPEVREVYRDTFWVIRQREGEEGASQQPVEEAQ